MKSKNNGLEILRLRLQTNLRAINSALQVATSEEDILRIGSLVKKEYQKSFPNITTSEKDSFISQGISFFTRCEKQKISGTISITPGDLESLPDEKYFQKHIAPIRSGQISVFQVGRFVVAEKSSSIRTAVILLQCLFLFQQIIPGTTIVGLVKSKDVKLHTRHFGAQLLASNIHPEYAPGTSFSALIWDKNKLTNKYFETTHCPRSLTVETDSLEHHRNLSVYGDAA